MPIINTKSTLYQSVANLFMVITNLITTLWQSYHKVMTTLSPHCDDLGVGIDTVTRL